MSFGMHSSTPPSASTIFSKPAKSTTTKPSSWTSVMVSTVFCAHSAPDSTSPPLITPWAKAALNFTPDRGEVCPPDDVGHDGTSIVVSRGIDSISTRDRSDEMCMIIVVSERAPSVPSPTMSALSPPRLSEPMSRMFSGMSAFGSSGMTFSGRSSPSSLSESTAVMLLVSFTAAVAPPTVTNARTAVSPIPRVRATVCRRRARACEGPVDVPGREATWRGVVRVTGSEHRGSVSRRCGARGPGR